MPIGRLLRGRCELSFCRRRAPRSLRRILATMAEEPPFSPLPWALDHPGAALTALGLASFAWIGTQHALYYGLLGVSPSEVGIGYAETLSRGAIGFTAIGILIAGSALLVFPLLALMRSMATFLRTRFPALRRYLTSVALGLPIFTLAVWLGFSLWGMSESWLLRSFLFVPVTVIWMAGQEFSETISFGTRGTSGTERTDAADTSGERRRGFAVIFALLLLLLPYASTVGAAADTRAQRPLPAIFSALTGLRGDRVTVTVLSTNADLFAHPVTLLGGTDEYLVFLDSDRSIQRVPPSAVMLSGLRD